MICRSRHWPTPLFSSFPHFLLSPPALLLGLHLRYHEILLLFCGHHHHQYKIHFNHNLKKDHHYLYLPPLSQKYHRQNHQNRLTYQNLKHNKILNTNGDSLYSLNWVMCSSSTIYIYNYLLTNNICTLNYILVLSSIYLLFQFHQNIMGRSFTVVKSPSHWNFINSTIFYWNHTVN